MEAGIPVDVNSYHRPQRELPTVERSFRTERRRREESSNEYTVVRDGRCESGCQSIGASIAVETVRLSTSIVSDGQDAHRGGTGRLLVKRHWIEHRIINKGYFQANERSRCEPHHGEPDVEQGVTQDGEVLR